MEWQLSLHGVIPGRRKMDMFTSTFLRGKATLVRCLQHPTDIAVSILCLPKHVSIHLSWNLRLL